MIAIIDYGAGNLQSVHKALDYIGAENFITASKTEIEAADAVILPGVGSFGDGLSLPFRASRYRKSRRPFRYAVFRDLSGTANAVREK